MKIEILKGTEPRVYELIAPFAMSRKVIREFDGYGLFTDETYNWFIAFEGDKMVGFSAIKINKKDVDLTSAYVIPEFRKKKIHDKMIKKRLSWCRENGHKHIKVDCQKSSLQQYIRAGFKEVKTFSNWHKLELNIE